jgi:HAD superfamily hydrolase (TIGR01509 family)
MTDSTAISLRDAPDVEFEGILFDMDGLLLDTERLSHTAWRYAEQTTGQALPENFLDKVIGLAMNRLMPLLSDTLGSRRAADQFFNVAFQRYQEVLHNNPVPCKPGALEVLQWLDEKKIPRCLASSSQRFLVEHKLSSSGLGPWIPLRVCGDEVTDSKPHPDIYRKAAAKIGLAPERCLALEDSPNGILSAFAAGCQVVHIPDIAPLTDISRLGIWKTYSCLITLRKDLKEASK